MSNVLLKEDEYSGQIDLKLWRRILGHAAPYRSQLIGLAASGVLIAVIDAVFPLILKYLIDEAVENGATSKLTLYGAEYVVLSLLFPVLIWFFIVIAGQAATGIARDLRQQGFAKLQELSFSYFDVRPVGWLVSRITADCTKLSSLIPWFMLDLAWGISLIVCITVSMFLLDWKLAFVVLAIVPPLAVITLVFQKKLLSSSRQIRKINSQMTAGYNECIMGVRTTKSLVREDENLKEFQVLSSSMFQYSMQNALQSAVYLPIVITLASVGTGLALWRGGLTIGSDLSLGTLIAFMQYAALFYHPIQELARRVTDLQSAQAAAERVQDLLDTEPEIKDSEDVLNVIQKRTMDLANLNTAEDGHDHKIETITFKDVTFCYKEGQPILKDFNLTVHAGQTVALVGATGGGKSTIVSLIARFYEPSSGDILINNVDYRQRSLHWLQSNLGVVLQSPHLFSGTIRENLRYGRLDATDIEMEEAARVANAHTFIMELDNGYDTQVGEGGGKLSTGQRQLVSLARAVLADPQIFIMDEATSSVDTETEKLIQDGIDAVLAGRIAFVIAHRLSTIRSADVILVIDNGRIVEQGSHDALINAGGRYRNLYTRQFATC